MTSTNNGDAADVLVKVITGIVSQMKDEIIRHIDDQFRMVIDQMTSDRQVSEANIQEILSKIGMLRVQLTDVTKGLYGEKRKTKTTTKSTTDSGAGTDGASAEGTEEVVKKKFDINKMVWTKRKYREDETFRNWLLDEIVKFIPSIRDDLMNDPVIAKKTNVDQKIRGEATYIWLKIKANSETDKTLANELEKKYKDARTAFEMSNQPPQQTAEEHTPEQSES